MEKKKTAGVLAILGLIFILIGVGLGQNVTFGTALVVLGVLLMLGAMVLTLGVFRTMRLMRRPRY